MSGLTSVFTWRTGILGASGDLRRQSDGWTDEINTVCSESLAKGE